MQKTRSNNFHAYVQTLKKYKIGNICSPIKRLTQLNPVQGRYVLVCYIPACSIPYNMTPYLIS
jgi:hypothetical protein